jgi:lipopolysaccharide transport system ATP-binding protein
MSTVIKIEGLYKEYKLGVISHGTLYRDLQSWWARVNKKKDPNSIIGEDPDVNFKNNLLAIKDLNLEVEEGEVLGVIGHNGAGKSTLLKMLSRITTPTSGKISIKGKMASLLEVGTGFHPELTGRENIYLNGAINGMSRTEVSKKLDKIVKFSGVGQFLDTPVKRYSSGMYVRLGFSVATHLDPDILIVDEVLAVGDAEFQKKAIGKMKNLSTEKNRTVIFVSHNMKSIQDLCTRCILIENGAIIYQGNSKDVVDYYYKNIVSHQVKDLSDGDYSKRNGNGKVRFTSIDILNEQGEKENSFTFGSVIVFRIKYTTIKNVDNLIFSIFFSRHSAQDPILIVKNYITKECIELGENGTVEVRISTESLNEMDYQMGYLLSEDGIKKQCDFLEDATSKIRITKDDLYQNGKDWGLANKGMMRVKSSIRAL